MTLLTRLSWFPVVPASRLAAVRVIVGGFAVANVAWRAAELRDVAAGGAVAFHPVGLVRLLEAPLTLAELDLAQGLTVALGVAWTLGLAWRLTGPAFGAAFLCWASYRLSWGAIAHDLHVAALHVVALSLTPAAATLSLDAALTPFRRRWTAWIPGPTAGSAHYGWPLRLLSAITVATYTLAGIAKVDTPAGLAWARGENLGEQIAYTALLRALYEPERGAASVLVTGALAQPWILSAAASLALALELGAPLALLGGRVAGAWVLGVVGMHVGIAVLMGIVFPYQTFGIALLSFVVVERILPRAWR